MKRSGGPPRKLRDEDICRILKWHQQRCAFEVDHGSVEQIARELGVSAHAIRGFLHRCSRPERCDDRSVRPDRGAGRRVGRPAALSAPEQRHVLRWHQSKQRFMAEHRRVGELATELQVGVSTIYDCIRRGGRYPQRAVAAIEADRSGNSAARSRGTPSKPSTRGAERAFRASLLRRWALASLDTVDEIKRIETATIAASGSERWGLAPQSALRTAAASSHRVC